MSRFEGALASSRPFVVVAVQAATGQDCDELAPARVQGIALIDTGAELSGIARWAADQLALITNATTPIATATGCADLPRYSVRIEILFNSPTETRLIADNATVFEDRTKWQAQLTGFDVAAIIGMDLLAQGILTVDGPSDTFELTI